MGTSYYITFEDKSVYQIHEANIEFCPSQILLNSKFLGGENSKKTPFRLYDDVGVEDMYPKYYYLTFKNKLLGEIKKKLDKETFFISGIPFQLESYNSETLECKAVGWRTK